MIGTGARGSDEGAVFEVTVLEDTRLEGAEFEGAVLEGGEALEGEVALEGLVFEGAALESVALEVTALEDAAEGERLASALRRPPRPLGAALTLDGDELGRLTPIGVNAGTETFEVPAMGEPVTVLKIWTGVYVRAFVTDITRDVSTMAVRELVNVVGGGNVVVAVVSDKMLVVVAIVVSVVKVLVVGLRVEVESDPSVLFGAVEGSTVDSEVTGTLVLTVVVLVLIVGRTELVDDGEALESEVEALEERDEEVADGVRAALEDDEEAVGDGGGALEEKVEESEDSVGAALEATVVALAGVDGGDGALAGTGRPDVKATHSVTASPLSCEEKTSAPSK